ESIKPPWSHWHAWLPEQLARYAAYPIACSGMMLLKKRPTLFHVLDHSSGHLCYFCRPTVCTCHDLADWRKSTMSPVQLRLWKWRVRGWRKAARIIAISRNTAADVEQLLGLPPDRIVVIPYGISPLFRPLRQPHEPRRVAELQRESRSTVLILHVGTNS